MITALDQLTLTPPAAVATHSVKMAPSRSPQHLAGITAQAAGAPMTLLWPDHSPSAFPDGDRRRVEHGPARGRLPGRGRRRERGLTDALPVPLVSHARAPVQARALWPSVAYVSTTASGQPLGSRNIHRSLAQLCKRAGIVPAISHYELRNTAITFQCEARYTTRQIADWAGTSERMISDVYRHKLDDESPLGPAT